MAKRIAIFDFDGTLADTNEGIVRTYQATLRKLGLPETTPEKITSSIGLPLKQILFEISDRMTPEMADRGSDIYLSIFNDIAIPYIKIFNGVFETLATMKKNGLKLAVASSRGNESLGYLIKHLGFDGLFDEICGLESVVNHKPAPDLVNKILSDTGLTPDEALVVGDTTFDIMMGNGAGCATCGVTFGNHTRERLQTASPTYIVDTFPAILELV